MGAALVGEVLARWTHLPDRPFRVLVRMALTALDQPNGDRPARLYFGGRDLLAMSFRSPFPEGDDKEAARARATMHRRVREAVNELIAKRAIDRHGTAYTGHQQEYLVHLRGGPQKAPYGGPEKASSAARRRPPRGGPQKAPQGATTGTTQEQSQETDTPLDTDSKVVGHPQADEKDRSVNGEMDERERQAAALWAWMREQEETQP